MSEKPTILLVDDDYGPMEFFKEALALYNPNYWVSHVDSADKALDLIEDRKSQQPALVVQDLMMPMPRESRRRPDFDYDDWLKTWVTLIKAWQERFRDLLIVCLTNTREEPEAGYHDAPSLLRERNITGVEIQYKFKVTPNGFGLYVAELLAGKK